MTAIMKEPAARREKKRGAIHRGVTRQTHAEKKAIQPKICTISISTRMICATITVNKAGRDAEIR